MGQTGENKGAHQKDLHVLDFSDNATKDWITWNGQNVNQTGGNGRRLSAKTGVLLKEHWRLSDEGEDADTNNHDNDGEDGVNLVKRYCVNHIDNENTQFIHYLHN